MSDWREQAACLTEDPDLFFPIGNTGPALLQIEDAKAVCAACPVWAECLAWALDTNVEYGIYGGHTEQERLPLLKALRRARRETAHRVAVEAEPGKTCRGCGLHKPHGEYHCDRSTRDGRQTECRSCRAERDARRVRDRMAEAERRSA